MEDKKLVEAAAKDYIKATGSTSYQSNRWEAVGLSAAIMLANNRQMSQGEIAKIANEALKKVSKDSD